MLTNIANSKEPVIVLKGEQIQEVAAEVESLTGAPMPGMRNAKVVTATLNAKGGRDYSYE